MRVAFSLLVLLIAGLALLALPQGASSRTVPGFGPTAPSEPSDPADPTGPTEPADPDVPAEPNEPAPSVAKRLLRVKRLARRQVRRHPRERRGDNVPRYRRGRGRIAPFSIRDQWCVAFATWVWDRAGFDAYQRTRILWPSWDGTMVAVQVWDLSKWARRSGRWSLRARPGYLVAYGRRHIGIVTRVDRDGRAVRSIEGNKGNRVSRVRVPFEEVTGYISPVRLPADQWVGRRSRLADVD